MEQLLQESMKKKELKPVDHGKISYINVRKNLYIIPKALATASDEQASTRTSYWYWCWQNAPRNFPMLSCLWLFWCFTFCAVRRWLYAVYRS